MRTFLGIATSILVLAPIAWAAVIWTAGGGITGVTGLGTMDGDIFAEVGVTMVTNPNSPSGNDAVNDGFAEARNWGTEPAPGTLTGGSVTIDPTVSAIWTGTTTEESKIWGAISTDWSGSGNASGGSRVAPAPASWFSGSYSVKMKDIRMTVDGTTVKTWSDQLHSDYLQNNDNLPHSTSSGTGAHTHYIPLPGVSSLVFLIRCTLEVKSAWTGYTANDDPANPGAPEFHKLVGDPSSEARLQVTYSLRANHWL